MNIYFIFFLCLLTRIFPRLLCPNVMASDTAYHMYVVDTIKNNHMRIPTNYNRFIFKNKFDYPFLYHYILAFFPKKFHHALEKFSPCFFDAILFWILYFFTKYLYNDFDGRLTETACLLFTFHPALLMFGSGPRIHYGSPRILGQVFYTLHLCLTYYAFEEKNIVAYIFSIITIPGMFYSSKFSLQALIFTTPFISIIAYPFYFTIPIIGVAISIAINKTVALNILHGSIKHSLFYYSKIQKVELWPSHTTLLQYQKKLLSFMKDKNIKKLLFFLYTNRNPFNTYIFFYPDIIFFIFCSIYFKMSIPLFFLALLIGGTTLLFLTESKKLMFLGSGERYIQYVLPTLLPLIASKFNCVNTYYIYLFCIYGLISYSAGIVLFYKNAKKHFSMTDSNRKFFHDINSLPSGNILSLGPTYWISLLYTKHTLVIGGNNLDSAVLSDSNFELLHKNRFYPSEDIKKVIDNFSVDYILASKTGYNFYIKNFFTSESIFLEHATPIFKTEQLLFFTVKKTV